MFGKQKTALPPKTEFTPTGDRLSADKLKFGYWFVKHRLMMRRILILVLIGLDIALILFVLYGFLDYYVLSRSADKQMQLALSSAKLNYSQLYQINEPTALFVSETKSLVSGTGKYDFVAEIENTNPSWYASEVKYHFEAGNVVTETKIDYVLPSTVHYFVDLGVEVEGAATNAVLVIENVKWDKVADFDKLQEKILNIEVIEPKYISSGQSDLSGNSSVSRVEFKTKNNSAYNFWQVDFVVQLMRGSSIVYVNSVPVKDFKSGQEKDIAFNIYQNITSPGEVRVVPMVDILNPDNFRGFDL